MPILIVIYGAGGFARELAWLAELCTGAGRTVEVACFVDDDVGRHGSTVNGIAVLGLEEARHAYPTALMVGGVGNPATRERLLAKAGAVGFDFCTLIHPGIQLSDSVTIGSGTVICPGAILTTNITLGRHVQINLNCTVGHDARLDDFVTLAPGVHVSGWVHVERGAYLGTGATVVNGTADAPLVIGERAIVGAGACVLRPVSRGVTVWGVPARPLRAGDVANG